MSTPIRLITVLVIVTALFCFPINTVQADSHVVTNHLDSGAGSLRQAILDASNGDTIMFADDFTGDNSIKLSSQLVIDKGITITGIGHNVTISGNNAVRVFQVTVTGPVFDHLTIADGNPLEDDCAGSTSYCGGGMNLKYDTGATITNSTFKNNSAGSMGGAINSYYGDLTISNSTFVSNEGNGWGGAINSFYGRVSVSNGTFVGNHAYYGGAISGIYEAVITVTNSTFSENSSNLGGAIYSDYATISLSKSIFSKNTGANCTNSGVSGTITSNGGNIVWGDSSCPGTLANPRLSALGSYGGSTQTLALLPGSAAIDAGIDDAGCSAQDQRGVARPQGVHCDSGAFESQGFNLGILNGSAQKAIVNTAFANPLQLTVTANAAGEPVQGGVVTLTPPSSGPSASFDSNPAVIAADGTIDVITTANGTSGDPYDIAASAVGASGTVTFTNLTNLSVVETTISSKPDALTNATSASFVLAGSGGSGTISSYECSLDSGDFTPCSSPKDYSGLAASSHTFQVRAVDSLGNKDTTPASYTWEIETTAPTVLVSSAVTSPTRNSTIQITITFSEAVTGFTPSTASGGIVIGGAGGVANNPSGSGKTYTFDLAPTGQGAVTVQVLSGAAQDAAGNDNTLSNAFSITYDSLSPDVAVSVASGQANTTNAGPIRFTALFSEPVSGFTSASVTLGGSAGPTTALVSEVAPNDGTTYSISVSGMSGEGTVTAGIAEGAAQDEAGNLSEASATSASVDYVTTGPTVSMSSAAPDPTNGSPIAITVTFSRPVTGFVSGDITTGNAAVSNFQTVSGSIHTFDLTPNGDGLVTADISVGVAQDLAGNPNAAASRFNRIYDGTAPTVTINQAASQDDPTKTGPIQFSIAFSEPIDVSTFAETALTFGGTAPGTLSAVITEIAPLDGTTFDLAVTGMSGNGTVSVSLSAGKVNDPVGNGNSASTSIDNTVTYAAVQPSTTTLAVDEHDAHFNPSWTLTANVVSASGTPDGNVVFRDGTAILGTSTLVDGTASLEVTKLSFGGHVITAEYQGSSLHLPSTSQGVQVKVNYLLFLFVISK